MYTFLTYTPIFYNFYDMYLEILRFKICFENCAKSKRKEQKRTKGVLMKKQLGHKSTLRLKFSRSFYVLIRQIFLAYYVLSSF